MQALHDIIGRLADDEREHLLGIHEPRTTVLSRMIADAIADPTVTKEEFIARHGITAATYNKSQSQAIDALYEMLSQAQRNPYDPIILIRQLLFRGLVREAKKQFLSLEKEYLRREMYAVLDTLYHEGVRICYHSGDTKWLAELVEKINLNSGLLKEYNAIDTPLILQMLKLEKKRTGERLASVAELREMLDRSRKLGHPVLINNSLYCLYIYYTQHDFSVPEALDVARAIRDNAERHRESSDAYTITLAYNNYAHFLCTYIVEESPEPYYGIIAEKIGMGGSLEIFDFHFQYFLYYLFTGERARAVAMFRKMRDAPAENRFALLLHVAAAWLAFAADDRDAFNNELGRFYATPSYQDFPEHEFHLRVMEILLAVGGGDHDFAAQKMDALRKFHYRNFQPAEDYRALVNALQRMVYAKLQGEARKGRAREESIALRSVAFLHALVEREMRG